MERKGKDLRKLVYTSIIIAIATVLNVLTSYLALGGAAALKISVSAIFIKIPAVLFGPLYGGITGALADILGYLIKPNGGYIFPMTLTAALGCVLTGFIFKYTKKLNSTVIKKILISLSAFFIGFSFINNISVTFFSESNYAGFILSSEKIKLLFIIWFELIGIGLAFILFIDFVLGRLLKKLYDENFIKLLVTFMFPNILVTTLNTFILKIFIPGLSKVGFWTLYAPRLIEEVVAIVVQSIVISYIIRLYYKISKENG